MYLFILEYLEKMKDDFKINLNGLDQTKKFANKIVKILKPRSLISIRGKLGVGKTTLVRFLINSLSKKKVRVLSPTFPIVNTYEINNFRIWHYDLYRLKNKHEIFNLDFDTALLDCVIIEWPEIIEDLLPKRRIDLIIDEDQDKNRNITVIKNGKALKLFKSND